MKRSRTLWAIRPRWRVTDGDRIALGPGKIDLLDAIDRAGSISGAAAELKMSYRRAWTLANTMNESFREPLVATSPWRGKGAALTASGRRVLGLYRRLEEKSLVGGRAEIAAIQALLAPGPVKPQRASSRNAARRRR